MRTKRAGTAFRKGSRVRVTDDSLERLPPDCGNTGEIERMHGATATVRFKSKSLGPYMSIIPISDLRPAGRKAR